MSNTYHKYLKESFLNNWNRTSMTNYPGKSMAYKDVARAIHCHHALYSLINIRKGERIAICGRNSANWAISFLSITTYGSVAVPLLHEFTPDNIHSLVNHSGSRILFVTRRIWKSLDVSQFEDLEIVISIDDFSILYLKEGQHDEVTKRWQDLENETIHECLTPEHFCETIRNYDKDDFLVLSYTSGTSSNPKGVMIPCRAISSNIEFGFEVMPVLQPGDNVISMLPMAHTFGLSFEFLTEFCMGMNVHFLVNPLHQQYLMNSLAEIRPKLIVLVPLLLEKIVRKGVYPLIQNKKFQLARKFPGVKRITNKVIRKKLYNALGGNFYQIIIGGAALSNDVEMFLKEIRYPFTVGYGMTECSPIICYSDWKKFVVGSCGKAAPRMEVKIDSDDPENNIGEILTRGDNVMLGYYKNEEATKNAIDKDGWLHTGDVGTIDKKGNLFIKGRCKAMILGSNGQNIYPEEIEDLLAAIPFVSEVLVVQRNGNLYALVYPDYQNAVIQDVVGRDELKNFFEKELSLINKRLPAYERVSAIEIMDREFEKTPKKSIKRYLYS